ncbi:polypeptide N-acetylgalactosaminyltransferase 13-like [Glandiceps talaboti]
MVACVIVVLFSVVFANIYLLLVYAHIYHSPANSDVLVQKSSHQTGVADRHVDLPINKAALLQKPVIHNAVDDGNIEDVLSPDFEGPGALGRPLVIKAKFERERADKLFSQHMFNVVVSDQISINRSLPDVRPPGCSTKVYPTTLPMTSIIIVFHNEAWSTLLRTVHSVINRSPSHLLKEIILVDDGSDYKYFKVQLEVYVKLLPVKVLVKHLKQRSGIVRARLHGIDMASAEVLTFLDSHCECTDNWLEPLLARISQNRTTVVCPIINNIDEETFEFDRRTSASHVGGFKWNLMFAWNHIAGREVKRIHGDRTLPVRSPVMAGGLFAIDRQFLIHLGLYDPDFQMWGTENLELSFKIWMCGGTLEIVPCSHVGHVYRKIASFNLNETNILKDANFLRNNHRLAAVWMDEYKYLYYISRPRAMKTDPGDLTARHQLRRSLHCHSFHWYLKNIYPEVPYPIEFYGVFQVRHNKTNECIDFSPWLLSIESKRYGFSDKSRYMYVKKCDNNTNEHQLIIYTKRNEIRVDGTCLSYLPPDTLVRISKCHRRGGSQEWRYHQKTRMLEHSATGLCLDEPKSVRHKDAIIRTAMLKPCQRRPTQKWDFVMKWAGNLKLQKMIQRE